MTLLKCLQALAYSYSDSATPTKIILTSCAVPVVGGGETLRKRRDSYGSGCRARGGYGDLVPHAVQAIRSVAKPKNREYSALGEARVVMMGRRGWS